MASVYQKTVTKPVPDGAEIIVRKGQRLARWKTGKGKARTAPMTTGRDGSDRIVVHARTYMAKYRDGSGVVREVATGCRDETAARAVLAELERRAELVKSKVLTSAEDAAADHQGVQLREHFDAYASHLEAKAVTRGRIDTTRSRLKRVTGDCGFKRLSDLNATALERWLVDRTAEGMSAAARNGYRSACVGFGNWCRRTNRLTESPFSDVPRADERADPRRKRRAMTEGELARSLYVARWRPLAEHGREQEPVERRDGDRKRSNWRYKPLTYDGIDAAVNRTRERLAMRPDLIARLEAQGRERALIYKALVLTGLRRGELASLTVGHLEFDNPVPHATLNPADEKNREGNSVPLRADLAADLRCWLADLLADAQERARAARKPIPVRLASKTRLLNVPTGLVRILNRDLAAAGIPKRDERGRTLDVHSMRTTFGTLLSKGGVAPRVAQSAMRHSSIDLTMNVYTDPKVLDVAEALNALPTLPLDTEPNRSTQRATGTDGGSEFAPPFAPTPDNLVQTLVQTDKAGGRAGGDAVLVDTAVSSSPDAGKQS